MMLTLKGQIQDLEGLMRTLVGRDDWCKADQRVVDSGIGDKIGLELVEINVESTVKSEAGGDGADDLGNKTVQMFEIRSGYIQIAAADVIDSLIVHQERAVRVLDGAMSGQDSIVWLDHSRGNQGGRVDGKLQLAFLSVVGRKTLQQESTEARPRSSAKGVEDEEALKRGAVICRRLSRRV